MQLLFIRHSEVLFNWQAAYDSNSFDLACAAYDSSPVRIGRSLKFSAKIAYISTLQRTEETAHSLFSEEIELVKTDLLNEIPLRSFTDTNVKLPTFLWMILGRLQWYFNHPRQAEGRNKSRERINSFLTYIEQNQQDCIIIGHGFYFTELITELKKRKINGDMTRRIANEEIREFDYK